MRRRVRGVGAASILSALVVGLTSPAAAIVGPSADANWLADRVVMVLERHGTTAGFCSGIVLAPTVVLTAAHCVPSGADIRVHLSDPEGAQPSLLPIQVVSRHPGYRPDAIRTRERSIDLALVRLAAPLSARFAQARLGAAAEAAIGATFTVAGYGLSREGEPASSGRLLSSRLVTRPPLSAVLLWAGDPTGGGAGACTGDSGGPVVGPDGSIVALTLWAAGRGRKQCGDLTQALWLAPHRAWIDGTLAKWGAATP